MPPVLAAKLIQNLILYYYLKMGTNETELRGRVFVPCHPSHGSSLLVRSRGTAGRAAAAYACGQTFALVLIDPGKW